MISARRLQEALDVLMAIVDENNDWSDPWQHVMWCGLVVASQAAVGARHKEKPSNSGLDTLHAEYARATESEGEKDVTA